MAVGNTKRQLGRHAVPTLPRDSGCDVIASLPGLRGGGFGIGLGRGRRSLLRALAFEVLEVGSVGFHRSIPFEGEVEFIVELIDIDFVAGPDPGFDRRRFGRVELFEDVFRFIVGFVGVFHGAREDAAGSRVSIGVVVVGIFNCRTKSCAHVAMAAFAEYKASHESA